MSFSHTLTPNQRRVANGVVAFICRGSYGQALQSLDASTGILPSEQEQSMRQLLERLQGMGKMESLVACEALINELQLPQLDVSVIDRMNTHIPPIVLTEIYEQMLLLTFYDFYKQLEHVQWVEHTIIWHTLMLYEHCTKLKAAQKALDQMQQMPASKIELYILYGLLLPISIYLATFLF
ncbi:PREDICTED: uncharacterized protein LOC108615170 [Drosophila arizonae]|uniref:Uncharacterized protein LOC108615170 n=1 Tax=Drosophila arizonae TaxID=7263 RepID=A0ABM1PCN4_DROAR|nr:PREDICTED: uncharacterized protein LOC108615170 [Drosophila arizonae]XP_017864970.1 PREDICTED: uncharacterized protein LOC108615170 [Drosophila arizonae]